MKIYLVDSTIHLLNKWCQINVDFSFIPSSFLRNLLAQLSLFDHYIISLGEHALWLQSCRILSADCYFYRKNDLIFIRPYFTLSVVKNNKSPLQPCCKAAHLYDKHVLWLEKSVQILLRGWSKRLKVFLISSLEDAKVHGQLAANWFYFSFL